MLFYKLMFSLWMILLPIHGICVVAENIDMQYLLPENHPAKVSLDAIFSFDDVLDSLETLKVAGFIAPELRPKQIVIGVHPCLEGYLLKLYLNDNPIDELAQWLRRIAGAQLIENEITRVGYHSMMSVPKKWIYKIPGKKIMGSLQERSILVVEDMQLVSPEENAYFYQNDVTEKQLDALAHIFIECKLVDSLIIHNVPLTKNGKISFIDTEHAGKSLEIWMRISKFAKYLSPKMSKYWGKAIQKNKNGF